MTVLQEKQTGKRTVRVLTGAPAVASEYGFFESSKIVEQTVEADVLVWINDVKLRRLIQLAFMRESGEASAGYIRVRVSNIKVLDEKDIA